MSQALRTFHGDPNLKREVVRELRDHFQADAFIQGTYWDAKTQRGCAVGCLTKEASGGHDQYPERWGIPTWLAFVEDSIFEGLPIDEARRWPLRFMLAIPVGIEITREFADKLAVMRIKNELLRFTDFWDGWGPEGERAISFIQDAPSALANPHPSERLALGRAIAGVRANLCPESSLREAAYSVQMALMSVEGERAAVSMSVGLSAIGDAEATIQGRLMSPDERVPLSRKLRLDACEREAARLIAILNEGADPTNAAEDPRRFVAKWTSTGNIVAGSPDNRNDLQRSAP